MTRTIARAAGIAAALATLMFTSAASASGTFVQHVHVLATFHGPTTGKGAYFGWAVSELRDVNGDGVTDLVIGEVNGGSDVRGRVWVYSGRTHKLLWRRAGRAGDQNGYAVADAGDVNGDGVPDVISGVRRCRAQPWGRRVRLLRPHGQAALPYPQRAAQPDVRRVLRCRCRRHER